MPRFSGMSLGDLMKVVLTRIFVFRSAFLSLKQLPIHGFGLEQGGRSCAKARRAFAENFGLGLKSLAVTYSIFLQYQYLS